MCVSMFETRTMREKEEAIREGEAKGEKALDCMGHESTRKTSR